MRMKLQTRFFCAYLLMSLLIIGVCTAIFYRYTSDILIERETGSAISLNEAFLSQTEQVIEDMDTVSINIGYSNLVKESLYDRLDVEHGTDDFRSLANLFVAINGADVKVDQINLYDFRGHVLQVGLKSNSADVNPDMLTWSDEALKLGGKKLISLPYSTAKLTSSANIAPIPVWYLSLYRTFNNKYKRQVGYIETVKRCSSVFKYIESYRKKTKIPADVYVYNQDGVLLYPYSMEPGAAKQTPDYFASLSAGASSMRRKNEYTHTREILVCQTSAYTGWTYVTVQPESRLLLPVRHLLNLSLIVVLAMLLFCAFVSLKFSEGLIRPIRKLSGIIRETALENLGQEAAGPLCTPYDELEELNQEFSQMSAKLKTSMDQLLDTRQQEMKSRSLALQSQINPHFYYNTLSSVIVLAENGQCGEVTTLCRNLTKIMRYITDSRSATVPMIDELNYIREYLYCMKVRYQSSLNYEIQVDERLSQEFIPRLIIQPLVENALKYATNCAPPWKLSIQSEIGEDNWKIHVTDTGAGFTPESLSLIRERTRNAEERAGMPEMEISGMGLLNVYIRWKLFCGEEMLFEYGNTPNGHGRVSIGRKTSL